MHFIGSCFERLEGWINSFAIEVFASVLQVKWIEDALAECGRETRRVRKLPASFVVWLSIALGFYRTLSIKNVAHRMGSVFGVGSLWQDGEEPASASLVEARDRVGFGPMRALMLRLQDWLLTTYRGAMSWNGWLLMILDGTTMKVPDSEENRRRFGLPGVNRGQRAAFPQLRALFFVSAHLRLILGAWFAPYRRGELTMAVRILDELPKGCLLLMDRLYAAWGWLWSLTQRGHQFVTRIPKHVRPRRIRTLGPGDHLVEARPSRSVQRRFLGIPQRFVLRELSVRIRGKWYRYLTSFLDPAAHPAIDLVRLYCQRWEEEIGLDEIKTHECAATTVNRPLIFRSMRSRRVLQEAYALVIAYNLIRTLMTHAAQKEAIDPLRISFVDSLERIREAALLMAAADTRSLARIFQDLLASLARCVLPKRRDRSNRREVCIKMSSYPKKWKAA
ncbi:MAG: IS4 family transposase [Dongiaceae bacterium]